MSKPIEIPFSNDIGQRIYPGDKVVTIASGYGHDISIRTGIYVGLVNNKPSVIVNEMKYGFFDADGKNIGYYEGTKLGIKGEQRPIKRRTTLFAGRVYKIA